MFHNNAQCDIYIGTGAGKKLIEEIARARTSVKIVSPFLSEKLVKGLIRLYEKGVKVELITTETDQGSCRLPRELLRQNVHTDRKAEHRHKVLNKILNLCYRLMGLLLVAIWLLFTQMETKFLLYSLAFLGAVGTAIFVLRNLLRRSNMLSCSYEPIFPVRVIKRAKVFRQSNAYLHSKIYIIDDAIVYLGSLNFTRGGIECNYETRVRLTDDCSVGKIVQEFRSLMALAEFPDRDIR